MLRTCLLTAVLIIGAASGPAGAAEMPSPADATVAPLALSWNWDWDECRKFWSKQLGKTTGVVGTVSLVVVLGVLIVMSAKKKT